MIAVDSSVAIAAFGEWHVLNEPARSLLDEEHAALPAHALLETYCVLTGYPPPHRAPADVVSQWLKARFPTILPPPPVEEHRALIHALAAAGRTGGATYDALIGWTARLAGAVLVTADARAAATYELAGVQTRQLTTP